MKSIGRVATAKASSRSTAVVARAPRQLRGQARVEGILDAAAAMIVDDGLAGVTMHELARRSQTSIGSLYHFFPDRESVVEALYKRHQAVCCEICQALGETSHEVWQQLSAASVIERLLTPYLEYLRQHADFLAVMQSRLEGECDNVFIRLLREVLEARLPNLAPAERATYAAMLHAIGAGITWMKFQTDPANIEAYLREIPRVLTAYLIHIDMEAGGSDR